MQKKVPNLARIRSRIFATLIDDMLVLVIPFTLTLVSAHYLPIQKPGTFVLIFVLMFYIYSFVIDIFSYLILPWLTKGKSIGKALFGIRIVRINGAKPSFKSLAARYFIRAIIVLATSYVGMLINLFITARDKNRQGIHDQLAQTIVIKSPTVRVKRVIIVLLILSLLIGSTAISLISLKGLKEKFDALSVQVQEEKVDNAKALIGTDGPLSLEDDPEFHPFIGKGSYMKAYEFIEKGNYEKAKVEIDKAFQAQPDSMTVMIVRCHIYIEIKDKSDAYRVCKYAYEKYPNHPALLTSFMTAMYYSDKCNEVVPYAEALAKLRMSMGYSQEEIEGYYSNAGITLAICDMDPVLGNKFLYRSIELTKDSDARKLYEGYLR